MSWFLHRPWLIPICLFLLSAYFFTINLAGQWYSLDEPTTVFTEQTINQYGVPQGWDGKNLVSDNNGAEYNLAQHSYVWTWQPPLQFYLPFVSAHFLGNTVFANRLPFALLGALAIVFFYFCAWEIFQRRWVAIGLSLQMLVCLPFFLYVRQVRYYSPSACFGLALFYLAVRAYKKEWTTGDTLLFIFCNILLFLTNYIIWGSSMLALLLIFLLRRMPRQTVYTGILFLGALLWYIHFRPYNGNAFTAYAAGHNNPFLTTEKYLSYIHAYLFPFFLIPLFFVIKQRQYISLFILFILIKLLCYAPFLDPHGRYLIDLFPICILLFGYVYIWLSQSAWKYGLILLIPLFALVNTGAIVHGRLLFYPQAYQYELTETYPTMFTQLATYMQKTYHPGDIYWSNSYRWYIYNMSVIPSLSPACNMFTQTFNGPSSVANANAVRWFLFFQNDGRLEQTLDNEPCLGKAAQQQLLTKYKNMEFSIQGRVYGVNDPDIVNRQFPPRPVPANEIRIYERK